MIKINVVTEKGGAVELNKKHGVWASYAVAGVDTLPPSEILYAGVNMKNGKTLSVIFNRETGLLVVDVVKEDKKGRSAGVEVIRRYLHEVKTPRIPKE